MEKIKIVMEWEAEEISMFDWRKIFDAFKTVNTKNLKIDIDKSKIKKKD